MLERSQDFNENANKALSTYTSFRISGFSMLIYDEVLIDVSVKRKPQWPNKQKINAIKSLIMCKVI